MTQVPALRVQNISKQYGATTALADVSLDIAPGEIHAVLGENGAGKSTLVKILSGVVTADHGELHISGQQVAPKSLLEARTSGISTAFQELSLLVNLTVAENLLLPQLVRGPTGLISRRTTMSQAEEILQRFGVNDINPSLHVEELSLAQKQRIEITRALFHATCVLILDEPSAALADTTWLFEQVRSRAEAGVAVLYISHRLSEVRSLCSRATVLRNGQSIDSVNLAGVNNDRIFELMVGHSPDTFFPSHTSEPNSTEVLLEGRGIAVGKIREASFTLRRGEILGVAALEGQGQRDLLTALAGLQTIEAGELLVEGKARRLRSPRHALRVSPGIAFVPEERKVEGIFAAMRAAANITLPNTRRISRFGLVTHDIERRSAADVAAQVELQQRYLDFRISNLSGGNQQKAVIGRALNSGARILVLFDPTRGVDVGTKQVIYTAINQFVDSGGAVLIYSSELPELTHLCDRCLLIYRGRITAQLQAPNITEQSLVAGIVGYDSAVNAETRLQPEGENL